MSKRKKKKKTLFGLHSFFRFGEARATTPPLQAITTSLDPRVTDTWAPSPPPRASIHRQGAKPTKRAPNERAVSLHQTDLPRSHSPTPRDDADADEDQPGASPNRHPRPATSVGSGDLAASRSRAHGEPRQHRLPGPLLRRGVLRRLRRRLLRVRLPLPERRRPPPLRPPPAGDSRPPI